MADVALCFLEKIVRKRIALRYVGLFSLLSPIFFDLYEQFLQQMHQAVELLEMLVVLRSYILISLSHLALLAVSYPNQSLSKGLTRQRSFDLNLAGQLVFVQSNKNPENPQMRG